MDKKDTQSMIPNAGGVLQELTMRTKLILRLFADQRVSPWAKLVPLAGLIYWISPLDVISGIPGLSAVDDVAVLWFVQYAFIELCPPEVVREITRQISFNGSVVDGTTADESDIVDGEVVDVTGKEGH
jgi:uncharacterized membrane protein YkvA (DUF1232 family)